MREDRDACAPLACPEAPRPPLRTARSAVRRPSPLCAGPAAPVAAPRLFATDCSHLEGLGAQARVLGLKLLE